MLPNEIADHVCPQCGGWWIHCSCPEPAEDEDEDDD